MTREEVLLMTKLGTDRADYSRLDVARLAESWLSLKAQGDVMAECLEDHKAYAPDWEWAEGILIEWRRVAGNG